MSSTESEVEAKIHAWENGVPFASDAMCRTAPEPPYTRDELNSTRQAWAEDVQRWLESPMGVGIPADHVFSLLSFESLGPWMAEIEATGGATLAIKDVHQQFDDGTSNVFEFVVIRIEHTNEDPFDWIADDGFTGCELSYSWWLNDVAVSALGICEQWFWATDTDTPAAWRTQVLWPLGYKSGDSADLSRFRLRH